MSPALAFLNGLQYRPRFVVCIECGWQSKPSSTSFINLSSSFNPNRGDESCGGIWGLDGSSKSTVLERVLGLFNGTLGLDRNFRDLHGTRGLVFFLDSMAKFPDKMNSQFCTETSFLFTYNFLFLDANHFQGLANPFQYLFQELLNPTTLVRCF